MSFTPSFTPFSWWNLPIPADVAVDPNSDAMIAAQAKVCDPPRIGRPTGAWAIPWSEVGLSDAAPWATIVSSSGGRVTLHVDPRTGIMAGNDAAVIWRDWQTQIEVSTFETFIPRLGDGTIDTTKPITCTNYGLWGIKTNGIARKAAGGQKPNNGHRGIPPSVMALHPDEVTAVRRRLKISLAPPADHPGPNWPMTGIESPRHGGIPEGAVLRLKDSALLRSGTTGAALEIASAANNWGFIAGDTGGSAVCKTVQGGVYGPGVITALEPFTWQDWEIMTLGWGKP